MSINYNGIKSDFIRSKLRATSFDRRDYIDDLLRLYDFVAKSPTSFLGSLAFLQLRNRYQNEYLNILKESFSARYRVELRRLADKDRIAHQAAIERRAAQSNLRQCWLSAGGQP